MHTPKKFPGQRPGEEVVFVVHRHWFDLFSHMFFIALLTIGLMGSFFLFAALFPDVVGGERYRLFLFLQNTFFLFLWLYGFLIWIDYYFDVWIITNERIMNIEQKGLFMRHISELSFARVQDVTSTVEGIIPTMLNFGDLYVQTAAETERFIFRQVGDPLHLKDAIMRLAKAAHGTTPEKGL